MHEKNVKAGLEMLWREFGEKRVQAAVAAVKKFSVEVPSWVFGRFGGGRFGGYMPPGGARTIEEKLDDAAFVHHLTGATPAVAMHTLWDFSSDGRAADLDVARRVSQAARQRGLQVGAVNPTYFLEGSYRGSMSADEKGTVQRYIEQTVVSGAIARQYGNGMVTLWFPDGSAYPGQRQLRRAFETLINACVACRRRIPNTVRILIEYKVFEPGTYSTTVPDWGAARMIAQAMGGNTGVLIDMGHHHPGTNVEQIVAMLIADGMPGGFHFNTRYAADDDHAVEPSPQMARIFYELVEGNVIANRDRTRNWGYMIDQCSGRENRMRAVLHSVDSLQQSLAKAMLVDTTKLRALQDADRIIPANRLFNDAIMNCDVRPIVAQARLEKGLPVDPVVAYTESGYQERIERARG
jgi:L-rhamnose isomerase/sugar isomerase